jgi:hypothetical protein
MGCRTWTAVHLHVLREQHTGEIAGATPNTLSDPALKSLNCANRR